MTMLAALFEVPRNRQDWDRWSWNNKTCVDEINQAIFSKYNTNLQSFPLDPIPWDAFYNWLAYNQQSHDNFNGVLGLQGQDLESVDINDAHQLQTWVWLNYQELYSARAALQI